MGIELGDTVTFNYQGELEDGSTFHTFEEEPLTIIIGSNNLVKGLERAVIGMEKGEEKEFALAPEEGYGILNPELIQKADISVFENTDINLEVGIVMKTPHGNCHVTDVSEETVELSYNHPLASKTLIYKVKILEVAKK